MRRPIRWAAAAALVLGAGAAAWFLLSGRGGGGPVERGAGVLLITIDTLRADAPGFAGNAQVETPVLDRLARGGQVFDDAHAHNVVTLPSHANILTGLYPYQHGVRDNSGFALPAKVPTLATRLKAAGYATAAFVGAYPLDASFGLNQGFDTYDDKFPRGAHLDSFVLAERRGDKVVEPALAWWNAHRSEKRFLWIHLYDPHAAYAPPEPFATRYKENPYWGEVAATDSFLAPILGPLLDGKEPPTLVVVTSDTAVHQQQLEFPLHVNQEQLTRLAGRLNGEFGGRHASEIPIRDATEPLSQVESIVVAAVVELLLRESREAVEEPVVEGVRELLRQPEFDGSDRILDTLEAVDESRLRGAIPSAAIDDAGVAIVIGDENRDGPYQDMSFVLARYGQPGGAGGVVGVLGPTRMPYNDAVAHVRYVGDVLTELMRKFYE